MNVTQVPLARSKYPNLKTIKVSVKGDGFYYRSICEKKRFAECEAKRKAQINNQELE